MIFTSELPSKLGQIGSGWRQELGAGDFENCAADVSLVMPSFKSELKVVNRDAGPDVEVLPGIQATLQHIDEHFRRTFQVTKNVATEHDLTVRTGVGNATAAWDMVGNMYHETYNKPPYNRLRRSMTHIDIANRSDLPKLGIPDLLYTVVYGKQTEWFNGKFFLPLPPGANNIGYLAMVTCMHLFLRPKTLVQKPFAGEEDHLLAFTRYDVHRMPAIDLSKGPRFLLRDAVTIKNVKPS